MRKAHLACKHFPLVWKATADFVKQLLLHLLFHRPAASRKRKKSAGLDDQWMDINLLFFRQLADYSTLEWRLEPEQRADND